MRDRRPLINLLIGVISGLVGFAVVAWLRQRRCGELGGSWDDVGRRCALATGDAGAVNQFSDIAVGLAIAAFVAFMCFRIFLYATGQGPRPRA